MNGPPRKFRGALLLALGLGGVALAVGAVALVRSGSASSTQRPPHETDLDAGTPAPERVFITGSLVNLREAASPTAKVLTQLPIGRECTVEEKGPSGWWRIRYGSVTGWVAAEFLSPEKPTVEPLLALAEDLKRPFKERFDAALRAVTLEPEKLDARERFWNLFVEQELAQVEDLLAKGGSPRPQLQASVTCEGEGLSAESCLEDALERDGLYSGSRAWNAWHHFAAQQREREGRHMFVSAALGRQMANSDPPPQLVVRVGTFEGDAKNLDVQVFTVRRDVPSDILKAALAPPPPPVDIDKRSASSMLAGKLSEEELGLLSPLPHQWTRLTRRGRELVILPPCDAHLPEITLQLDEEHGRAHVKVEIGNGEGFDFDVMRVQSARDGSVSLRTWDGRRMTYSASRDDPRDPRLANWTLDPDGRGFSGPFVRSEDTKAFRRVHPQCWDGDPPESVE